MKLHVLIESSAGFESGSLERIHERPRRSPPYQSGDQRLASLTTGVHGWNDPFARADRGQEVQQGVCGFCLSIPVHQRVAASEAPPCTVRSRARPRRVTCDLAAEGKPFVVLPSSCPPLSTPFETKR